MPIIHLIPDAITKKNNIHLRKLENFIAPIAGRGSQGKTSENTKIELRRPSIQAYILNYINRTS